MHDKIKKLFALANSANEHEAKLALENAYKLMAKYNISISNLSDNISEYGKLIFKESKLSMEDRFILRILKKHYFISVIYDIYSVKGKTRVYLLGKEENIIEAIEIYEFIKKAMKKCWNVARKVHSYSLYDKQSFYFGFQNGLNDKLEKQKQALCEERALMVIDKQLTNYVKQEFPSITKFKQNIRIGNAENSGYIAGKNTTLNKVINHG